MAQLRTKSSVISATGRGLRWRGAGRTRFWRAFMRTIGGTSIMMSAGLAQGTDATWRSRLYREDWTPTATDPEGRFLHDMSYAGYRNGEAELPAPAGPEFNVVTDLRADATGMSDATEVIQRAVDAAVSAGGGIVRLPAGLFRCDGIINVTGSGVIIRGAGTDQTRLHFTSVPGKGQRCHITVRGRLKEGPDVPLVSDGANRSFDVFVKEARDLAVGDDVNLGWAISEAFVGEHGMEGTWKAFNGNWRPFFQRRIAGIDRGQSPHRITLDVPLRYTAKVRDGASLRKVSGYVSECGVESLSVSNAVARSDAWSRAGVHVIGLESVSDCWVRDVVSFPSPLSAAKGCHLQNGGIFVAGSKRVTIADCTMAKAQNRGGGGAGYLFHISRSNEVLTRDCVGIEGRHNFIQNWDFGTTGCVWLRCASRGSRSYRNSLDPIGWPAFCEYHHSLAMACLVDQCALDDGWFGGNRRDWSSGAGNTVTQSVYWNTSGKGESRSWQDGLGYVIGTTGVKVKTKLDNRHAEHTAPEDYTEGLGQGATLVPQSLYEDQLRRRLTRQ